MNLIAQGDKGYQSLLKFQKKQSEKEVVVEPEQKIKNKKLDGQRLDQLSKPKDKWKLGKRLLEL